MKAHLNRVAVKRSTTVPALAALATLFAITLTVPSHAQVNPSALVDGLENLVGGKQAGFRRSGAKGVCASGEFIGNAEGRALSTATVFSGAAVPVVARFAFTGPNPRVSDKARVARGLSLDFKLPGGEVFQMANLSTPVFTASTPETFVGFLESRRPDPATKMADPAKVKAFNEAHPEVLVQAKFLGSEPVPAGYGQTNYWGVHSFAFVNSSGQKQWAKWMFEPVAGFKGLSDEELKSKSDNFAFDELRQRVATRAVEFNFKLQLAQPGDVLNSATVPLPAERKQVTVGRLRITAVEAGEGGACEKITFIPTLLPKGIETSDDPMLQARAAPYAVSLGRRLSEGK